MQKTIGVLKEKGIIDNFQKHFNECKPPKGTHEEQINNAIEGMLDCELDRDEKLVDAVFEAFMADAAEAIKKELKIEYCEPEECVSNISKMLADIFGHANVHVHVVQVGNIEKDKGDE